MRIVVKSREFDVVKGISKRNGQPYELRVQTALLHRDDEVRKIRVTLGRDQEPYAPGNYTLSADSFQVSDFGDLVVRRIVLMPVQAQAAKVA